MQDFTKLYYEVSEILKTLGGYVDLTSEEEYLKDIEKFCHEDKDYYTINAFNDLTQFSKSIFLDDLKRFKNAILLSDLMERFIKEDHPNSEIEEIRNLVLDCSDELRGAQTNNYVVNQTITHRFFESLYEFSLYYYYHTGKLINSVERQKGTLVKANYLPDSISIIIGEEIEKMMSSKNTSSLQEKIIMEYQKLKYQGNVYSNELYDLLCQDKYGDRFTITTSMNEINNEVSSVIDEKNSTYETLKETIADTKSSIRSSRFEIVKKLGAASLIPVVLAGTEFGLIAGSKELSKYDAHKTTKRIYKSVDDYSEETNYTSEDESLILREYTPFTKEEKTIFGKVVDNSDEPYKRTVKTYNLTGKGLSLEEALNEDLSVYGIKPETVTEEKTELSKEDIYTETYRLLEEVNVYLDDIQESRDGKDFAANLVGFNLITVLIYGILTFIISDYSCYFEYCFSEYDDIKKSINSDKEYIEKKQLKKEELLNELSNTVHKLRERVDYIKSIGNKQLNVSTSYLEDFKGIEDLDKKVKKLERFVK